MECWVEVGGQDFVFQLAVLELFMDGCGVGKCQSLWFFFFQQLHADIPCTKIKPY